MQFILYLPSVAVSYFILFKNKRSQTYCNPFQTPQKNQVNICNFLFIYTNLKVLFFYKK